MLGEEIDVRGPVGEIWYKGHGKFEIDGNEYRFHKVSRCVSAARRHVADELVL